MCRCSPESQPYPRLNQERSGQQIMCVPGVLCPGLGPPKSEGYGVVGVSPEEAMEVL